jgi:menaquinone-dependent protoporphyrinogen oxidase
MKRIVGKAGGSTDTTRDHEYTDWNDLRDFARTFATRIAAAEPAVSGGVR